MAWTDPKTFAIGDLLDDTNLNTHQAAIEELQGRLLATTATINPGSIAAATVYESGDIAITGAAAGDAVVAIPPATIEANLTWCAFVSATDTVRVRIGNPTVGAIVPASATWGVRVVKANP